MKFTAQMPNQDDQNNSQAPQHLDPVMDIPPMVDSTSIPQITPPSNLDIQSDQKPAFTETIVEEQTQETKDELPTTINEDDSNNPKDGSAAPSTFESDNNPIISTTPKKKFGGGKIIATILGILMLVGGIGGGVYLTQQNQDIRERAGSCGSGFYACNRASGCCPIGGTNLNGGGGGGCNTGQHLCSCAAGGGCVSNSMSCATYCGSASNVVSDNTDPGPNTNNTNNNNNGNNDTDHTPNTTCGSTWSATDACSGVQVVSAYPTLSQGQRAECNNGRCQVYDAAGNRVGGEYRLAGDSGGDTPTSPPTTPTASCVNVKAYTESWVALSSAQLSQLNTGSKLNFCVNGTASAGIFTKAKFTINGAEQAETTTKRPTSEDYCQLYTIPSGVSAFNVSAQIYHATLGWK